MSLDSVIASAGQYVPASVLEPLLRATLQELRVALCFHRVAEVRRATDWQPSLSIPPVELDALLGLLVRTREDTPGPWLTVTFDDGYADAAAYIESRAPRFPSVEWLFFVCPQKTERSVGYRWDLIERAQGTVADFHEGMDVAGENLRPELGRLGLEPDFALATVEDCRRLAKLANVQLGNHTNCHFRQTFLSVEAAQQECERSAEDFERLFGPQSHFAFPFGSPGHQFGPEHVALVRQRGPGLIWSTERRPFRGSERVPGAVLPRYPMDGTRGYRQLALGLAAWALAFRARGTRHLFP